MRYPVAPQRLTVFYKCSRGDSNSHFQVRSLVVCPLAYRNLRRHPDLNRNPTFMSTHGLANHCLTIRLISAEQTCPDSNRNKQFWRLSCYQLHHRSIGDRRDLNPYTTEPQSAPLSISGTATVRRAGLEPAVSCVSDRRSNRLNYLRCFRKESNLHLLFRKQPFFPLYYGSEILLMRLELIIFCFGSRRVIQLRYSNMAPALRLERRHHFHGYSWFSGPLPYH